ncbi:hypothetical protein [Dactylosporangium sp. NPDC049140]|uniref:hypothetical protein n=1 Tax=Dactylosporangium sp. NPDC049140 TaxID=3155647 RepID=UPI0033C09730
MADIEWDPDDVLVTIGHSWGDFEVPLMEWMARGPGPRNMTRPESARSRSTGKPLPLAVIPLEYRNDAHSRALIAAGRIKSPWQDTPWDVDNWGEKPYEIGGPRPFPQSVPQPEQVDRLIERVFSIAPQGLAGEEAARLVLAEIPEFRSAAALVVRRLAGQTRWDEFETIVGLAAAGGLVDISPVLCELLVSNVRPPHPERIVDVLSAFRYDDAVELLESLVGQFVYADEDLFKARRCLRALAVISEQSRIRLTLISWSREWPPPIPRWAAEELEKTGERIPSPFRPDA